MRNFSTLLNTKRVLAIAIALIAPLTQIVMAEDQPLIAVGPLSSFGEDGASLTINNQNFLIDRDSLIVDSEGNLHVATVGDYVAINGELVDSGNSYASTVVVLDESYVPGSSPEYLRVIVSSVDHSTGLASSGDTIIDFNGALHNAALSQISEGDIAEFYGTTHSEIVWAISAATDFNQTATNSSTTSVTGLRGSGVRGLRGSGVRGLRGSGVRGLRGSGVRGLRGSGVRGLRGSGVRGLRGSGVRGLRGSGVRGLRGSGVR
jgi:hypothetical protein